MSTELSIFSKKPSYLANVQDEATNALAGNTASSIKKISIKGGVWRMVVGGKEIAKNEDRAMHVVIVNAAPVGRTYYEGAYQEGGEAKAPTCWSANGEVPDKSIKEPQARRCLDCAMNIKGSGQGESRACRFSQKVAVVMANKLDGDVFQLTLPATSIFGEGENGKWPIQAYSRVIKEHGAVISAVVTEMRFDTNSATPKLTFKPVRVLEEDEFEIAVKQGKSEAALKAIATVAIEPNSGKLNTPALENKPAKAEAESQVIEHKEESKKATAKVVSDDEEMPEPVKRSAKKEADEPVEKANISNVLAEWDDM